MYLSIEYQPFILYPNPIELKSIKNDPERGARNLVDLAMQFSEGRFQKNFFSAAQTMLQNENSAYYGLIRDIATYTDETRLFTFGMNLGYNGCTVGVKRMLSALIIVILLKPV